MYNIILKIYSFVKSKFSDIMLFIIVLLLLLLSFASGFIIAKYQLKQPIQIEETETNL